MPIYDYTPDLNDEADAESYIQRIANLKQSVRDMIMKECLKPVFEPLHLKSRDNGIDAAIEAIEDIFYNNVKIAEGIIAEAGTSERAEHESAESTKWGL
jgi:hypothetical protein